MHKIYSPSKIPENCFSKWNWKVQDWAKEHSEKVGSQYILFYPHSLQITDELRMYQAHDEKTYAKFEGKLQGERKLCGHSQKGLPRSLSYNESSPSGRMVLLAAWLTLQTGASPQKLESLQRGLNWAVRCGRNLIARPCWSGLSTKNIRILSFQTVRF